jgi:hypothetical protein
MRGVYLDGADSSTRRSVAFALQLELAEHRPREAAKLLRRALPLAERSLGPDHAETTRIAGLLAEARR